MRVVLKIGSNLLRTEEGDIDLEFLAKVARSVKALISEGNDVAIVSSGAVLCGHKKMNLKEKAEDLITRQALAGIGQAYLMHLYDTIFSNYSMVVAQVLLTNDVFKKGNEDRFRNAKNTLEKLMELRTVPVINENDTVAVSELIFGDNDFLSVYVAYMIDADLIVILSSSGGLMDHEGKIIKEVRNIEEAFGYVKGTGTEFGTGGMRSKLEATKLALSVGIPVIITGKEDDITKAVKGVTSGTKFVPKKKARTRVKKIALMEEPKGIIYVDSGAVKALKRGKSLLPAGIVKVEGNFGSGDYVSVANEKGVIVAKGRVNFSRDQIEKIKGLKGFQVKKLLKTSKEEVIHRDNMVVFV